MTARVWFTGAMVLVFHSSLQAGPVYGSLPAAPWTASAGWRAALNDSPDIESGAASIVALAGDDTTTLPALRLDALEEGAWLNFGAGIDEGAGGTSSR